MGIYAAESHDVLSAIIKNKAVTLEDVLVLRRQVWPDGKLSKSEVEMLFRMHASVESRCAEWDDFFVEALMGYLVEQAHPEGYVSDGDAAWFEHNILRDGKVAGSTELEALITLLERAVHVPHRLEMLALETVCGAILSGDKDLMANRALEAGIVGDPEVSLLRRILYSKAGSRSDAISVDEAKMIFELNAGSEDGVSCAAWTTLCVTVLSNYLLVQNGYTAPTRMRLKEIDGWLNRPSAGVIGFTSAVSRRKNADFHSGGVFADIKTAFSDLSPLEDVYRLRDGEEEMEGVARVDSLEARWLINALCSDGALRMNERALLVFLKAGGFRVDPALDRRIVGAA